MANAYACDICGELRGGFPPKSFKVVLEGITVSVDLDIRQGRFCKTALCPECLIKTLLDIVRQLQGER